MRSTPAIRAQRAVLRGHDLSVREAAIAKRIERAKKVLADSGPLFDVGVPADFARRLSAVHRALVMGGLEVIGRELPAGGRALEKLDATVRA
jgi:hypothetical protein